MVTRRKSRIRRIGIRSTASGPRVWAVRLHHGQVQTLERDGERVGERRLRRHSLEIDTEVYDRLRDLRTNAADDALGTHEARRSDRLQEMLRGERVDGR